MAEIIPNLSNETNHHDAALAASKDVPAHTVVAADKSLGAPTEATTLKGETAYTITQGKDTEKLQNAVYSFNTSLNPRVYENSLSNAISGAMKEYKGIYTSGNRPDGYNPYDSLNLSGVVMTEEQYGQAQRRLYEALADVEDEVIEADKKTTRDRVFSAFREQVRKAAKNRNGFVPQQIGTTTYDYPLLAKAEANVRRVKHNQGVEANALAQYKALPAEDRRLEDERISKKVASSMEKVTSSSSTSAFVAPSRVREVLLEDYQNDPVGRMAFLKKYADTIGIYQFLIESFDESVPSWRGQSDETIQLMAGSLFKNYGINLDPKSINPQYLKRTKIFNLQEALNFFGWLSPLYGPENTKETTYLLRKGDRIRNAQDYQEYQSANATAEEMNRWGEAGYQQYQQYVLDRLDEQYQGARGNAWYATAIPTILGSLRFMTEFAMSKGYGGAFSLANLMSYYLKASIPDKLNVEMGKDGKLIVKGKGRAFLTKFINETESGAISYFTEEKIGKLLDKGFSYLGQKIVPAGIRSFFSSSAISKFGIPKTGVGKVIRDVLPLNSAASEIVEEGAEKFIRAVSTQAAKLTGLEALDFNESFKITGEEAAMTAGTIVTQMALLGGIARVGNAFTAKRTNRMYSMQENVVRVAQQLNETNIKGDAAQKVLQDNGVGNQSICITPENAKAVQESAPEFAKSIGVTEESVLEAEKSQGLVEVPYRDLIVTMAESPTNIKAGAELVAKSNDALTAVDTKGMKQGEVQKALSEQLTKNREMEKVKQELVPAATEWAKKTMAEAKMDTADAKTVGQAMAVNLSFIAKENGVEAAKKALENISVKVTGEVQNYHSGDTVKEMGALDTNTPVGRALFDFYTASLGVNANLATPEEVAAEKDKRLAEAKAKGLKVNESVSPAAWYTEDGAITINPDAGMLFLFGHELGHLIQQASGGTESGFAGEIMKTVNSSKTKAMANLRQQIAQRYASVDLNGVNLFAEGTKNFDMELMGDVLGYVLQDPMTARVLAEEMEIRQKGNGSLFLYRVVEAIDKWISKIKELLGFLDKNAPEELRNARAMASALLNDYTVKQRKIASILADFQATYGGNASAEVGKQVGKKHTPLLDIPRLQLPSSTKENGVTVHKITDLGSSVKSGIKNQTDTIQFRNWFKNPSQIKSATDNVGTFDRNSNNIYYALTPVSDNALIEGPKAVLEIMQNATSLDFVDAIGRWGYQMAKDLAAADPEGSLAKDMEILDTWINSKENPHKQGTVEYEHWKADRFTEAFSRYIVNGTVAKGVLLPFGDLKRLLTHVYQSGKYNPKFAVPMEVRQVFDSILTASEEINDTLPYDTVLSMLGEEATQGLLRAGNKSVLRKLVLMSSEEARSIQEKMVHEELEPLRKQWYGEAKIAEENRPSAKAIKAIKDNGLLALSDIAVIAPDVDAETIGKLRERGLIREKNGQSAIKVAEAGGYADVQSMLYDVANGKSAVDFINEYMAKMEGDYLASREANPSGEAIGCESAIIMLNYLEDILTGKYNIDSVSVPAEAQKAMDLARELASLAAQKEPSANKIMMTMGRLSEAISKMGEEYADFKKDAQAIMDDMQSMQDKQDAEYYAKIEQLMGRVLKLDKAQDVRKVVAGISKAAVRNKYSARAAEVISGMTVGQILSSYRPLAEIRSNARNLIELLGQNTPNAEKAVLLADALMLKMETFRQLSKAKKNIEKAVRILKKEARVPAGKIDPEYQKALQELSYMFGLSGVDTGNDGQTLKAIANDEESRLENEGLGLNAEGPAIAPWILEQRAPLSYKALPMERMQDLVDAADYLYGKGKDIVQGEKEGKTLEVVESVLGFLRDQAGKEMTYTDSLDKSFLETVASTYRVSALEGVKMWRFLKELGPTMAAWYAKLSQAEHEEMALYQRTGLKAVEALDKLDALLSKVDLKKLPEFGSDYRSIKKWTTPRLTMALLYMGTTSGRQRLMDGFKWRTAEEAKVADDTDVAPILHQICGMVPAEALQQINIIWDAVNGELAKAVKAEYRKETYKELREIERAPFQTVSSDGKVVWMKGGYIPLSYQYSGPGEHLVAPSVGEGGKIVSFSANPVFADPSFTRGRMESYMDTPPLNLDVNTVTTHVQNAANYATHRTLIRQLYRVITNERGIRVSDTEKTMSFRERYVRTYGAERYKYMKGMLKYMANPYESVRGGRGMLAALTKSIFAFKALWGNFSPVLMQMTSASVGANEIGGFFWSSLIDMFAHPIESMRFASEVSPLIRNRAGFQEVALAEAGSRLGKGKAYRFWKNMQNVGMFLTNLVDRIVATIGFNGAYAKAMSEGKTHNAAVVEAEEFVAKTQGSKRPLDMMPVQVPTVSALKSIGAAMTPFISAVGAQQNVTAHNLFSVKGSAKVMGLVCSFLIPMLMQGWFRDLLTGGLSDDKKKRKKAHKRALAEMLAQPLAGVPYYRDLLESMARAAVGLRQHDPFSISDLGAVTDLWNKGWGVYDDLTNADWDHAIYMSVDAFSTAFGVPAITAYQRAIKILEAYGIDVPNFEDTKDKKNRRKK